MFLLLATSKFYVQIWYVNMISFCGLMCIYQHYIHMRNVSNFGSLIEIKQNYLHYLLFTKRLISSYSCKTNTKTYSVFHFHHRCYFLSNIYIFNVKCHFSLLFCFVLIVFRLVLTIFTIRFWIMLISLDLFFIIFH